jgi:DNA polymerase-3 subunit alpha/error-prone DNA polymerase
LEDFINRIPIGIEGIQTLIFFGAFRFTVKQNQLLVIARLILVNSNLEKKTECYFKPIKEYTLPVLERLLLKML